MAKRNLLVDLDLNQNELLKARVQNLASEPSSPVSGQIFYNTTTNKFGVWNGSAWEYMGSGTGATNLSRTLTATTVVIESDTGTDATIPAADTTNAGVMSAADKTKLNGVATGATANDTDANLKNRANHTGTQTASTISDFDTQVRTSRLDQMATPTASVAMGSQKITGLADPTAAQEAATKAYVDNSVQGLSWKQAVRAASTANVTVASGLVNGATMDGVTLATGDRVLLKDQSTASQNGIYIVAASGAASRSTDMDSAAEVVNSTVYVSEGTANADTVWTVTTNSPITLGTTSLAFAQVNGGSVPTASTSTAGKVQLATPTEAEAKTDSTKAVTPAGLANYTIKKVATIGDGSATQIDVTHNLGTKEVITQVRQASDDAVVDCDIINFSTSVVRLKFNVAPATNALKVVIQG